MFKGVLDKQSQLLIVDVVKVLELLFVVVAVVVIFELFFDEGLKLNKSCLNTRILPMIRIVPIINIERDFFSI